MIIRENKQEVLYMLKESISGFCMALADSVPVVSGGTVAFMTFLTFSFYDIIDFITYFLFFGILLANILSACEKAG